MVLVCGGIASGKKTFVRGLGYADADMGRTLEGTEPVLVGLEELLRERELTESELRLVASREVVVCLEVGQGVVPIDADERAWRERVGRCCQRLAEGADAVYRLVCGIAVSVKGA
jgi:adenosyl cobinamide kinase/adenosyl cobinamide phosphate guanylyltransferase